MNHLKSISFLIELIGEMDSLWADTEFICQLRNAIYAYFQSNETFYADLFSGTAE